MEYDEYLATMRNMLVVTEAGNDANFEDIVPRMIDYAELRLYRDLDLLAADTASVTDMISGTRDLTMPADIIIVDELNAVTPAATLPDAGTRVPLERVSLAFLNATWPVTATTGVPAYYALLSDTAVRLAPTPGAAYKAEFIGASRPTPLSSDNGSTVLTTKFRDLFVAASMIFGAGYQKNFGAQADDPKMAQSWEAQYQTLLGPAMTEEARRKGAK